MGATITSAASSWISGILAPDDRVLPLVVLAAVVLSAALALTIWTWVGSRRRLAREIRRIVTAVEDLRAGSARRAPDLPTDSPFAIVGDALARLGREMQERAGAATETTERLEGVLEAFRHAALITTDLDGDVRTLSEGALSLLGWERDEALALPVSTFFADGEYEALLPRLTRRAARERGIHARSKLRRRDGSTFPADLAIRALDRTGHEARGFLIVVQEVTEQVRLETELRASHERYRGVIEASSVGVAVVRAGRVLYANPSFAALCGVERDRVVDAPLRDRVATDDILLLASRLEELESATRGGDTLACTLLGADGRPTSEVRLDLSPIPHDGRPAVLVLAHDETATRRAEAEVRANEARLDAVLESTSDGLLVLDAGPHGGIARVTNAAFLDLAGLAARDVLGRSRNQIARALGERSAGHRALAEVVIVGEPVEARLVRLEGEETREITVAAVDLEDRSGRRCGRVVACRDLTAQRESERKLQQHAEELQLGKLKLEQAYARLDAANQALESRTAELDRLNAELRKLDEMKSDLLGDVTHELQTPLVSIRGYTEILLKERLGPLTPEQRKGLDLCLSNIDRLIAMIDRLATVSDPDAEELPPLNVSRFALSEVVDEAHALLAGAVAAQEITYTADLGPEPLVVDGDRDRILQVLLNLVGNAVKFNKRGGRIDVRARRESADRARIEIEDTGIGIAPDAIDHVFDRRYRATEDTKGQGLGLAIVREVLLQHGCRIEVTSESGSGTRFTFTLPVVRGPQGGGDRPGLGPTAPPAPYRIR